ncbi:MAG: MASE1 domain-containing protein, partial [Betaproteobacteria bacterium]|nr:MASE1 domain-containing protein [Betaproteobacteria bacterium]
MGSPGTRTCRDWQWGLAVAALYFGFALISLRWVQSPFGIAYIWPSSGIAVAGLLVLGRACRRPIVALVALASIAANLAGGASPVAALIFSLANVAEALVVVGLSRFDRPDYGRFESPAWVLRFAGAAVAGGLLSGAIALLGAGASDPLDFAISWITTVVLGILIVTPAAATFLRWLRGERSTSARVSPLTRYALLAVTLGASMLTFGQTDYPLLFVPLAMVILTTWLLGVEGAVVSVFVISSCAILATGMGIGPITFVESDHGEIVFLQFYLLVLQISALPLAAMLSETRRKEASLTEGKR